MLQDQDTEKRQKKARAEGKRSKWKNITKRERERFRVVHNGVSEYKRKDGEEEEEETRKEEKNGGVNEMRVEAQGI